MDFKQFFREPAVQRPIERYSASHRHPINQAFHFVGIPLLVVSALGLLGMVRFTTLDGPNWMQPSLGMMALIAAGLWYCWKSPAVGLVLFLGGIVCYFVAIQFSWISLLGVAGFGAVCHWIGHYAFEGKPPMFFSRPISVLEAPIWLIARWAGYEPPPKSDA